MASNTFSLKIISANRVFFTGRCQSVIVPGYDGQKEVLAHHENMVIAVNEGEMRFLPDGEEDWLYAEEIDIARAQEAKERALEKIRQKQSIQEYYHTQASLSRAMARLRVGHRQKHV